MHSTEPDKKVGRCQGGRISHSFQDLSNWTKIQIDMRHINKRKPNLILYVWGIHMDIELQRVLTT